MYQLERTKGESPVCSVLFPRLFPAVQSPGLAAVLMGHVAGLVNALKQPATVLFSYSQNCFVFILKMFSESIFSICE